MAKHKLYRSLYILFPAVFLSGCISSDDRGRDQLVFRYNEHANITSLDPAFARNASVISATNQLFNSLVQLDDSLRVRPDIAKRWEVIDSARTYRFTLRDDVYFHKHELFGPDSIRRVTAHDFVYSFDRLKNPATASPGSWVMQPVANYTAVNDTLLEISLKNPFPGFLGMLSMRYCSVVPREAVAHFGGDFRSNPIGTGPFRFQLWEENVKLVLRKNEGYFETDENGTPLPYLEAVAVTFLPDKQSEFLQFVQGNIDFISGLDPSYKDEILTPDGKLRPRYADEVAMIKGPYLNTEFIAFQTASGNSPVHSPLIRKAVNYGFDREEMIRYLRNGIGYPAEHGLIPPGLPGFDHIQGYTFRPDSARALVAQYMAKTGTDRPPKLTLTTDANYLDLYEYLQRELQKAGLDVSIEVAPASVIRQARAGGLLDAFRSSWIADYPDAENYLSLFYGPNTTPSGPNYSYYNNPDFDLLYEQAFTETDEALRAALYRRMDSLAMQDAPIAPLYYDEAVRFVRKDVKGLGINPQNFLVLKRVFKE